MLLSRGSAYLKHLNNAGLNPRTLLTFRLKSTMAPPTPLPYSDEFKSADEYVESLLSFTAASTIFQTLCGGVHILDFFAQQPSLYHKVIPAEWRGWLMACESMDLLDLLMRDDLSHLKHDEPPESLLKYIKVIRKHSLKRHLPARNAIKAPIPRHIAVGMIPKKIHEVGNFAEYVVRVADEVSAKSGRKITHFVDFGSGKNYLGRTLASPPYNKNIVAVESKELNINGAKFMDVFAGVAEREKVLRNKKLYRAKLDSLKPVELLKDKARRRVAKPQTFSADETADLRPIKALETIYTAEEGKGYIQYVEHIVENGDLSNVVKQIEDAKLVASASTTNGGLNLSHETVNLTLSKPVLEEISRPEEINLMAISIHSCGNLSHHGIRALLLNPSVKAVAIVGCCYNLLTERLSAPTYKLPLLRPNLQAINAPTSHVNPKLETGDVHGWPMSKRVGEYGDEKGGRGVRLNITARMMAVQAPQNWTEKESESFFTRHFYRALLQKLFLDWGVVEKIKIPTVSGGENVACEGEECCGLESTEAVIIGSLRKSCYSSFTAYVRGALQKLSVHPNAESRQRVAEKMDGITDEEIQSYEERYIDMKKELSVTWSLMAFSAGVVESLIVVDRWLFLREHMGGAGVVDNAWVEPVFEYGLSPRNLVVVGIKK